MINNLKRNMSVLQLLHISTKLTENCCSKQTWIHLQNNALPVCNLPHSSFLCSDSLVISIISIATDSFSAPFDICHLAFQWQGTALYWLVQMKTIVWIARPLLKCCLHIYSIFSQFGGLFMQHMPINNHIASFKYLLFYDLLHTVYSWLLYGRHYLCCCRFFKSYSKISSRWKLRGKLSTEEWLVQWR